MDGNIRDTGQGKIGDRYISCPCGIIGEEGERGKGGLGSLPAAKPRIDIPLEHSLLQVGQGEIAWLMTFLGEAC